MRKTKRKQNTYIHNKIDTSLEDIPLVDVSLINTLESVFPDKLPTTEINSYTLGILIGQRKVVECINSYYDNQRGIIHRETK